MAPENKYNKLGLLGLSTPTAVIAMSSNGLVIVVVFGLVLALGLADSASVSETPISTDEGVKCPHLPCPWPGNCTHMAWSHFWYHGKLCKGCQYCVNTTEAANVVNDECVKCPHLPCPLPGNCTHKAWSHFWYHGKLCKGCQYCVNNTETTNLASDETGPDCPQLPCPPPFPGCAKFEMGHHWYNGKWCPTCEHCVYWNISHPIAVRQALNDMCPVFKCPAPGHCDTELAYQKVTIPGAPDHCLGCPYCPGKLLKRFGANPIIYCPDVSCADPGHCDVPMAKSSMTFMGKHCPGCPYCPTKNA